MHETIALGMADAAKLIGVSRRSLENYARAKLLRVRKIGRRSVILRRDLDRFLATDQPSVSRAPHAGSTEQTTT
jgi:hypothetical protein